MLERPARGYFGGLWVFPGGGVAAIDDSALAHDVVAVAPDSDDFVWRAAALRETIEEVGLALTDPPLLHPIDGVGGDVYRQVGDQGAHLDGRRLRLLSQWMTPVGAPTRFDVRFYLAVIDGDPVLSAQPQEVVDMVWTDPGAALNRAERSEWAMVTPTVHHLEWLRRHPDTEAAWAAASRATGLRVEPIVERDGSVVRVHLPASAQLP